MEEKQLEESTILDIVESTELDDPVGIACACDEVKFDPSMFTGGKEEMLNLFDQELESEFSGSVFSDGLMEVETGNSTDFLDMEVDADIELELDLSDEVGELIDALEGVIL